MLKKIVYIILLSLFSYVLKADASDDLRKCLETVFNAKSLAFKVDVKLYNSKTDQSPQISFANSSYKKDNNFYSNFMGKTTIYNDKTKEMIEVNENNKTIIYSKTPNAFKTDTLKMQAPKMLQLDTTKFFGGSKATYIENNATSIIVEIKPGETSPYKSVQITIDNKTFLFKRIEYFIKPQDNTKYYERIVINYNFNTQSAVNDDVFSMDKYISCKGDNVKAKPAYAAYKIMNQLKPNIK